MRVREIADELGVSVSTVRRAVADLGLEAAGHAARADSRGALEVDAEGASMVADRLRGASGASQAPAGTDAPGDASAAYQAALSGLRDALAAAESTRRALEAQLDAKDAQIAELSRQLAAANERAARPWWARLLGRGLPPAGR